VEQFIIYLFQGLGGILMTVLWYLYKSAIRRVENLEVKLQTTREEYVHKDDIRELKVEINHRFDKLEDLIQKRIT